MAAARAEDRATTRTYLTEADTAAGRLGRDANYLWTAFGPTNVDIHRVATAGELGDVQVAIDLGPRVDTSPLPMERRVRHAGTRPGLLHLDLRSKDQAIEVARLESIGARRVNIGQGAGESWVVMTDVDGNEFCVLRALTPDELAHD
jgi:hypothetical protein